MKKITAILLVIFGLPGLAVAAGDSQAGQAKAALCSGCHGADGNSAVPAWPKLAGQNVVYLLKQMQDIKSGARAVPAMTGFLAALSDQDMQDIAAYFSSQVVAVGSADPALVASGESLYRAGNKDTGIAACTACHAPDGKGNAAAGFPALSGQHADYVAAQLRAFRAGERTNDGDSQMMRLVAFKLNDNEIKAVSSYVSGLH